MEGFIKLNHDILLLRLFNELNNTGIKKIVKKYQKKLSIDAQILNITPPIVNFNYTFQNTLEPVMQLVDSKIVTIIPQPNDYNCPICQEIYYKPIRLKCHHVFCHSCVYKAKENNIKDCPFCRSPDALKLANRSNLDVSLLNFLRLYFQKECKKKKKLDIEESAKLECELILKSLYP